MKNKKVIIGLLSMSMLMPTVANASAKKNEVELTKDMMSYVEYELVRTDRSSNYNPHYRIEKLVAEAKGFAYNPDNDSIIDFHSKTKEPINEAELKEIDEWAKWVYEESGASKQKSETNKALYLAAYLKTVYPYDDQSYETFDYKKASQIRSIPYNEKAMCIGFSYALVRLLDVIGIESYETSAVKDGDTHSVVRAYLDNRWQTIEASGGDANYNYFNDLKRGNTKYILPRSVEYVHNYWDIFKNSKSRYVVYVNKDIENYLENNNLKIFGY